MKILHLAPQNSLCGIATYSANLLKGLRAAEDNSQHTVISLPPKEEIERLTAYDFKKFLSKFAKQSSDYQAVHIQNEWGLFSQTGGIDNGLENFYFLIHTIFQFNKNVIITFHTEPVFIKQDGPLNYIEKKAIKFWKTKLTPLLNKCKNIVHTHISKTSFQDSGLHPTRLFKVTHGVLERYLNKNDKLPSQDIILSLFGHIASYKGYDLIFDALKLLDDNYKLIIIGGRHPHSRGNELEELLLKIKELNLSKRVLITGSVTDEEANYYHSATDICLAPHQSEYLSASGAITWSLTSGAPVIGSNVNSFREITKDVPDSMMLCHPRSPYEWAWAIKRCGEDYLLREKLISAAANYCEKFSWSNTASSHVKIYNLKN